MDEEEQGPLRTAMYGYLGSYVVDDCFYRLWLMVCWWHKDMGKKIV
jgi:hypothetical protein